MNQDLRILLVEDQAMNRALLRATVAKAADPRVRSATLVEAETLAQARARLSEQTFDIVLLDVRLPDGNGLDLARELALDPDRARIVIMSASVLPAQRAAALAVGADEFLAKPYRPSELVQLLGSGRASGVPQRESE